MTRDDALARAREWALANDSFHIDDTAFPGVLADLLQAVAAEEREWCAKDCEAVEAMYHDAGTFGFPATCARRIRARGEARGDRGTR